MNRNHQGRVVASVVTASLILMCPYALREAAAAWRAVHVSTCRVISGAVEYNTAGQLGNVSTTTPAVLLCPVDGDSRVRSWDTTSATMTLSGYSNGTNGIQAKVCQTWPSGGGGNCAASPTGSTTGVQQMSLPTTILGAQESLQYAYLWVQLAVQSAGSSNVVWGYVLDAP